jgi:CRP-like cAMP-binding protein
LQSRILTASSKGRTALLDAIYLGLSLISKRFDGFLRDLETHALRGTLPRLARLLLTKEEEDVVSGLTHKDLAQELGIHRESVTAALGELQKADIIEIGRKKIRMLHRARLERATREFSNSSLGTRCSWPSLSARKTIMNKSNTRTIAA